MKPKDAHRCCVYGCLNTQSNVELSFFQLPVDCERRNEWLKCIQRPDLLSKPDLKPTSYRVCSIHFEEYMISAHITRKLLPDAIPTKFLTNQASTSKCENGSGNTNSGESDVSTQTKDFMSSVNLPSANGKAVPTTTTGTQTDDPERIAQTSALSDMHRKRKLLAELRESKNKTRRLQRELNIIKQIEANSSLSLPSDDHNDEPN